MTSTGAQQVAEELVAAGVRTVFGVPGGHNLPLFAAVEQAGLTIVGARHEQGAGLMADGFARTSRRPGVIIATAGPGVTNCITPLAQAQAENVPLLLLALDNYLSTLDQPDGQFHGLGAMSAVVGGVARWIGCARDPAEAAVLTRKALEMFADGYHRPLVVQLPSDVLTASGEPGMPRSDASGGGSDDGREPDAGTVERLAAALAQARRPVIYAGGGAVGAAREVHRLAERLSAPVVTTVNGRGVLPDDHPLALGPVWDRFGSLDDLARAADLVLCVGTRLSPLATRQGALPVHDRVAVIDIDPGAVSRVYPTTTALQADAETGLRLLLERLGEGPPATEAQTFAAVSRQAADAWRAHFRTQAPSVAELLDGLAGALPRDSVVACDMTVLAYWAQRFLPVLRPGGLISPYYFGTLGFALPAAAGVAVADPDVTAVALCGDGGFLLNAQELAACMQSGLVVHVVVVNDGGYASVQADERRLQTGPLGITQVSTPSFEALARAHGWQYRVCRAGSAPVAQGLAEVMDGRVPSVLEIVLDEPLPMPYEITW